MNQSVDGEERNIYRIKKNENKKRTREIDSEDLMNRVVIKIKKVILRIDIIEKAILLFHSIDNSDRVKKTRRVKATKIERESIE